VLDHRDRVLMASSDDVEESSDAVATIMADDRRARGIEEVVAPDRTSPPLDHASRTAFHHAMVGMAITDPHGVLLASNPALERLLGRASSELVGTSLFSVTLADDVHVARRACESLGDARVLTSVVDVRFSRPEAGPVPVRVSTAKVLAPDDSVSHLVMHLQDVSDHVTATDALRQAAFHDPLTGVANRALLEDRLEHAIDCHRRDKSPLSVLFIDLDDFKSVNDTRGHQVGDQVLRAVALGLATGLRTGTTVARTGGDEFVVVCEDTTGSEADLVAQRLLAALSGNRELAVIGLRMTASIGIATLDGPVADERTEHVMRDLIEAADAAMYRAKRAGGANAAR
jgi:diguanylate cyclase (GGDEF)-like protein/PAS domain S-box-containing protein